MKFTFKNREFKNYCRQMYDSNCAERWAHGQHPYKSLELYVTTNEELLLNKFNLRSRDE